MATTKLSRTAGTPTSSKKFTISYWVKRSNIGSAGNGHIFDTYVNSTNRSQIHFDDDNVIDFRLQVSGSNTGRLKTNRVFRDTSAWYHIVASVDTTLGTADDRVKLYINGVQETSFSSRTNPSQNSDFPMAGTHTLGAYGGGTNYFDGTLAHFHFIDGTAYAPTSFGETDSTSGIWKPKTAPSVTYGTNGFFLKFENSAAMGTDSSGNSNTFTVNGTLTQNVDTPDNNFCTNNPLDNYFFEGTYTNANLTVASSSATGKYSYGTTTFGIPDGVKIYCEVKMVSVTGGSIQARVGLTSYPSTSATLGVGSTTYTYGYSTDSGNIVTGNAGSSYGTAFALGDIMGIAIDTVNNKLYFSKNGTWQNSGDPTSGSTGTGAVSIADLGTTASTNSGNYFLSWSDESNTNGATLSWNFGSGYFGTTVVSSAGTAASTTGIFEYDVPTGYQPLSTKGLNA